MRKLNYKEIYQLKNYLGISFSDEEERGCWDCPNEDIHKNTVEFILDSIDNTVFKLDNGHYIQFYF